jgi:hypothetical protein
LLSVADAVGDGRLAGLKALREVLAAQVDGCTSKRDLAALSLRLMDVLEQIEQVERTSPEAAKGTPLDEFTRRRAERQASGSPRAAGGSQRRR